MSNLKTWYNTLGMESVEDSPVDIQDGETPKEDFSIATNINTVVDTDKPAVVEIPAKSDDDPGVKTVDQGHQTQIVSNEGNGDEPPIVGVLAPDEFDDPTAEDLSRELQASVQVVEDDIDRFQTATAALEVYQDLLQTAIDGGKGVAPDTLRAIQIGVETLGLGLQPIVSNEAFADTDALTLTTVACEAIKIDWKAIVEAIKKAIVKFGQLLYDLWTQATGGATRALKNLDGIRDRLKAVPDVKGLRPQLTLTNPGRLVVDGTFVGNDVRTLATLKSTVEYIYDAYPSYIQRLAEGVIETQTALWDQLKSDYYKKRNKNIQMEGLDLNAKIFANAFTFTVLPPAGHQSTDLKALPAKYREWSDVKVGPTLPGGRAVVLARNVKRLKEVSQNPRGNALLDLFLYPGSYMDVALVNLEGQRTVAGDVTEPVPSTHDLMEIERALRNVLDAVRDNSKAKAVNRKTQDLLNQHLKQFHGASYDGAMQVPNYFVIAVQRNIKAIMRMATTPSTDIIGYVVSTANAFMSVLNRNVQLLEAADGRSDTSRSLPAPA